MKRAGKPGRRTVGAIEGDSTTLSLAATRIVEKEPISPTPREIGGGRDRFRRNSTSQFRRAVRDALNLAPFGKKP